ncbi:hypothetical protein Tco_0631328 [Tanacetum coccineum]
MKWPLHLQFVSLLELLLPNLGYGINDYPTSILTPSMSLPEMISSPVFQNLNTIKHIFVLLVRKEKIKKASHPPKPIPNSKQRLHLLHIDLYGLMRVESFMDSGYVSDISFLHVFGALCYPKNDCEDLGKLGAKAMYDDYIGGQPSAATRTSPAALAHQVL